MMCGRTPTGMGAVSTPVFLGRARTPSLPKIHSGRGTVPCARILADRGDTVPPHTTIVGGAQSPVPVRWAAHAAREGRSPLRPCSCGRRGRGPSQGTIVGGARSSVPAILAGAGDAVGPEAFFEEEPPISVPGLLLTARTRYLAWCSGGGARPWLCGARWTSVTLAVPLCGVRMGRHVAERNGRGGCGRCA
jgi:hypothetical protein